MKIDTNLIENTIVILINKSAPEPDNTAALELSEHLEVITGRKIPISQTSDKSQINIKDKTQTTYLLVGKDAISQICSKKLITLEEDTIEISTMNPHTLAIRGGGPRGTLYAVYELLEYLGVRWFHPQETYIPKKKTVDFPSYIHNKPSFKYREANWYTAYSDEKFAARMRYNGSMANVPEKLGGHWGWEPYVHTFFTAIPPAKYSQQHPEYYSFRKGQGRVINNGQLCLSNPDVLNLLTNFALKKMEVPLVRIVDLSQMDHANPCECPECETIDKKTGAPSGSMLTMANIVAQRTSKIYPDKKISILAYTYTQKPPLNMKAHPNVIVRLCHMNGCETHALNNCKRNAVFLRHLKAWKKIADNVYVWDYNTNFQHILYFHPNFEAIRADFKIFADLGISGLFLQGYAGKGCAFNELHTYAMARCLWNSNRDYFVEARSFLAGYYGKNAAPHLWKMIQQLHKPHPDNPDGLHLHLYRHPHLGTFLKSQLDAAKKHLDKAFEAAKGNDTHIQRLKQIAMWMNFTRMASSRPIEKLETSLRIHNAGPHSMDCYEKVKSDIKRFKIDNICEFPRFMNNLQTAWAWSLQKRDLPLNILENNRIRIEISPELNGMICTLLDKKTGIDLLCKPNPDILGYPYVAGMIERFDLEEETLGFTEFDRWKLQSSEPETVTMTLSAGTGLYITKKITLLKSNTGIRIHSTISNRSNKTIPLRPHCFVMLRAGELHNIHFFKRTKDTTITALDNGMRTGATTEQWISLSGQNIPDKLWGFFNPNLKIGLTEKINSKADFCSSNGYLDTGHVLTETRLATVKLAPNTETVFEKIYKVIHNEKI